MKQNGFSLTEFILVFAITSILFVMAIPPILRLIDQQYKNVQVNNAINRIYDGMTLALTTHWQQTQCRSAPALNLSDLINGYGVPANVRTQYTPHIAFISEPIPPYNVRFLTITLTTINNDTANYLSNTLNTQGRWLTIKKNAITITQPVNIIDNEGEYMNYNPKNGCID